MFKKIIITIFITIIIFLTYTINSNNKTNVINTNIKSKNGIIRYINKPIIGKLTIDKINLNKYLYDKNSKYNNIEYNIEIIQENKNLLVLAAHSGYGSVAFFNNLDKLKINDLINLTYYNNKSTYKIINIYEEEKNGYINIPKRNTKQLILTTCSKNKHKQLIIECLIQ